jgi:hypothetical protein
MQLTYNHRKKREREGGREKQSSVHHYQQLGISSVFIFFYSKREEKERRTQKKLLVGPLSFGRSNFAYSIRRWCILFVTFHVYIRFVTHIHQCARERHCYSIEKKRDIFIFDIWSKIEGCCYSSSFH